MESESASAPILAPALRELRRAMMGSAHTRPCVKRRSSAGDAVAVARLDRSRGPRSEEREARRARGAVPQREARRARKARW